MAVEAVQKLISNDIEIPSIPDVVARISALANDPDAGVREIGELVAQDAPLSSRVLRIANSAFYGMRLRVVSAEHAAAVLGAQALRNIVLQTSVMSHYEHLSRVEGFDVGQLWKHSIHTAQLSKQLGRQCSDHVEMSPEELYTCGLLHDLGKVVVLDALTEQFLFAVREAERSGRELPVCEREVLGYDHTEVGALVAVRWGLPDGVIHTVRDHHGPIENACADPATAVVFTANRVSHAAATPGAPLPPLVSEIGEVLALGEAEYEAFAGAAAESWAEVEL